MMMMKKMIMMMTITNNYVGGLYDLKVEVISRDIHTLKNKKLIN